MSMCCWVISPFCDFCSFRCVIRHYLVPELQFVYIYICSFQVLLHCCSCYMVQGTCFKIYRQTKFHPHRTTSGEDMTSYWFSRWQPWWLSTTSGFISNVVTLPKARIYLQTKYRRYTSINGWDIATSSFGKQTSTILEFFSPLWFRPYRSNRHAILHHSTNFNPNRSARGRDMTSYPFLKILLLVSQL